ncbi:hypothetical protein [Thalassotalea aquiviva]|uniref:hypothetical protein n=1 Tax=Thalassotalea aquiviva TaxID=3242415 RepID=UPI00352BB9E8
MSESDKQFQRWLEGKLSTDQSRRFEQSLDTDEFTKDRMATAKHIEQQVFAYEQLEVPAWDRGNAYEVGNHSSRFWPGWAPLSFIFSCLALVCVVFDVQVSFENQGFTVRVNSSQHINQTDQGLSMQAFDDKLKAHALEQELVLADFASQMNQNIQANNLQLAQYLITTTRSERQEDIADFLKYVNQRQSEDALDDKLRFQRLEYQLQNQALNFATVMQNQDEINQPTYQESNIEE